MPVPVGLADMLAARTVSGHASACAMDGGVSQVSPGKQAGACRQVRLCSNNPVSECIAAPTIPAQSPLTRLGTGELNLGSTLLWMFCAGKLRSQTKDPIDMCIYSATQRSWGYGGWGNLGVGTFYSSYGVPRPVKGGFAWASIRTAAQSTCGRTTAGALYCWGYNRDTMFGLTGTYYLLPKIWLNGTTFTAFDIANTAVFGVQSNGTIWSRGSNAAGLLGAGLNPSTVATSRTPRQVPPPYTGGAWLLVSAQTFHSCGFTSNYTLYCWSVGTGLPAFFSAQFMS